MKRQVLIGLGLLTVMACMAQGKQHADLPTAQETPLTEWQEALQAWMTAEDMEEGYGEEALELLTGLAETKINLNQTSREELEQLPFLSAQQVEGLVEYITRYGPLQSLGELAMVNSMDWQTRQLLKYFAYIGATPAENPWPKLNDVSRYGRHTLTATGKFPFYERKGDRNGYLGYKYRHDLRYQFAYNDRIKFGVTGAQDAGEPFFANRNATGYDFYSYYFQLRDMGRLESFNAGMYRVQLGMGLVMNGGFKLGKLATLQTLGRSTRLLTAHTSRSQADYLRGAAATVRVGHGWRITAFASLRPLDATLNANGTARTLLTDGYHRTPTEMGKKHNTHATDVGVSTGWRKGTFHINANVAYTHLDRRLSPQKENARYRQFAAEGSDFLNASVDYGYHNSRIGVAGETAISKEGALAALHTLSWQPTGRISLMALHRYYDKRYTALHAHSFSENSSPQNEHGVYAGAIWRPAKAWTLQGYIDYAHFAWPRYQVSTSSDAFDILTEARYSGKAWTLSGRYRLHIKQRDNSDKTLLENRPEHRLRLLAGISISPQVALLTQADAVRVTANRKNKQGFMAGQHATWHYRWLHADAGVAWFHTDDYDSRIYQYEHSVQHDYSFPMYYGHGIRYSLMARANAGNRLSVTAKLGVTNYFNRRTTGSGLQQTDRSSLADLLIQMYWKF